ncbi:MAG TPA: P1 family peptidase [Anaerolineae bacterium]|nr:P1 family peptidase [Anaerolineae bacterium]
MNESAGVGLGRARARDIGIRIGRLAPGRWNAITDVAGVRVGHTTLVAGEGPLVVGQGPVRTGVTVVVPHEGKVRRDPVFAGYHVLNGCGEMTGLAWIGESGMLSSPVATTNTFSVGTVHQALVSHGNGAYLPVVGETWDGLLSDIRGQHVKPEHVHAALDSASSGPVAEGCVGGGTGMICHGFKGGIGTASRVLAAEAGGWTVGALVQANHGQRPLLRVDGLPVGQAISAEEVPDAWDAPQGGFSSILVIVATDAPLLPVQCRRLAQRATMGVARMGGLGENLSGDIFLAFSTGNRNLGRQADAGEALEVRMLHNQALTGLFEAVVEATEEAIVNALCAATTTTGVEGWTAHALPLERLRAVMAEWGRVEGDGETTG